MTLFLLASQYTFIEILNRLQMGHVYGLGGFIVYYLFIPFLSTAITFRHSLIMLIVFTIFPSILYISGFTPNLEFVIYNVYVWTLFFPVSLMMYLNEVVTMKNIHDGKHLIKAKNNAEYLAMTDVLTGLNNRRAFYEKATLAFRQSSRYKRPLSLIILDIDKFKNINDTWGHVMGDSVIRKTGNLLKKQARESDISARVGGEEFAIILPETTLESAMKLAERMRVEISKITISEKKNKIKFTASFGVAQINKNCKNLDELVAHADIAMYKAKTQGRNRIIASKS